MVSTFTPRSQSAIDRAIERTNAKTLTLRIADELSLLNEIARRYESSERILMEFVDNALDDAEELYQANALAYPHAVRIEVIIDSARRLVTIRDNCRGMRVERLIRIVENVGDSTKKGLTWVNGRFGFGVHSFRAAAPSIRFRTKHKDGDFLELDLRRDERDNIAPPAVVHGDFPTDTTTGTEVVIGPFDVEWFEAVSAASVKKEIERHFERLLSRPNLMITVTELGGEVQLCQPFDYGQLSGTDIEETLYLDYGDQLYLVEVRLKVSTVEVPGQKVRFFARGRRINEVTEIKSFISKSIYRTGVWGHPHLLGYIEVGEIVKPVITRDDFQRTAGRTQLYQEIIGLEANLKEMLDNLNEAHRDTSLARLEDVLRDVLKDLAHEDQMRLRSELVAGNETGKQADGGSALTGGEGGPINDTSTDKGGDSGMGEGDTDGPSPDADGPANGHRTGGGQIEDDPSQALGRPRKRSGFDISFRDLPPNSEGRVRRSHLVDGIIIINTNHQHFKERMQFTRQGQPKFNERLCGYLAMTVSIHYKDQYYLKYHSQPEQRDQLFDEQVDFTCRLEQALRPHLSTLQEYFANGQREDSPNE